METVETLITELNLLIIKLGDYRNEGIPPNPKTLEEKARELLKMAYEIKRDYAVIQDKVN